MYNNRIPLFAIGCYSKSESDKRSPWDSAYMFDEATKIKRIFRLNQRRILFWFQVGRNGSNFRHLFLFDRNGGNHGFLFFFCGERRVLIFFLFQYFRSHMDNRRGYNASKRTRFQEEKWIRGKFQSSIYSFKYLEKFRIRSKFDFLQGLFHAVSKKEEELLKKESYIEALLSKKSEIFEGFFLVFGNKRLDKVREEIVSNELQIFLDVFSFQNPSDTVLFKKRYSIAETSLRKSRDKLQCRFFHLNMLRMSDKMKPFDNILVLDALKIVALRTRDNRVGDLVNLRRGEDELHMFRWFFQGFEKSVESSL